MAKFLDGLLGRLPNGQDFYSPGDARIIGYLKEAVQEGDNINADDPGFPNIDQNMDYIIGKQGLEKRQAYLPNIVVNQTKRAVRTHAAALTDIKPLFGYKTYNVNYRRSEAVLNNLVQAWWLNTFADKWVSETIKYSLAAGCGDTLIEYDPTYGYYGDIRLIPRDPRDTIPVRPSRSGDIQDWGGVILREAHTPNALRVAYPGIDFSNEAEGVWGKLFSRFRRSVSSPAITSTLDALPRGGSGSPATLPEVPFYRFYLTDRSVNLSDKPVLMGKPGENWSYLVPPGGHLYPGKRLIIATEKRLLFDGPAPDWHRRYPISRLKIEDWPWQFYGSALAGDLRGLQDAGNRTVNDILQVFQQWVSRTTVADAQSIPESEFRRFDPRKPLNKIRVKASMGDGLKMLDGPVLPSYTMEFLNWVFGQMENVSEVGNLLQLMRLKQMPGADTLETYLSAMTPSLRLEFRNLEFYLRDLAEMVKVNFFQYYTQSRRILILGDAGKTLQDFDYDPGTMIPGLQQGAEGYVPELDMAKTDRIQRAQYFHKLFTFYVRPGSLLAQNSQAEQMKMLQIARMGYLDVLSLAEIMEIPNFGTFPPVPLPIRGWKPEMTQMDPVTGVPLPPPMEVRVPETVLERLIAQQKLGIGMTVAPSGRKASGQKPPSLKSQGGGRTTIRES